MTGVAQGCPAWSPSSAAIGVALHSPLTAFFACAGDAKLNQCVDLAHKELRIAGARNATLSNGCVSKLVWLKLSGRSRANAAWTSDDKGMHPGRKFVAVQFLRVTQHGWKSRRCHMRKRTFSTESQLVWCSRQVTNTPVHPLPHHGRLHLHPGSPWRCRRCFDLTFAVTTVRVLCCT